MSQPLDRRCFLTAATSGIALSSVLNTRSLSAAEPATDGARPATSAPHADGDLRYCLNTGTIRGHNLPLDQQVERVAAAGYGGIEPWIGDIAKYRDNGGSLGDLGRRIADLGLRVESAIGFAQWIVDDDARRAAALEQLKRDMDLVLQLGGRHIAAPPSGATDQSGMDLHVIARRYRAALEVGREVGVIPQLELWGFSQTISRLGELAFVATEAAHPDACVLPDIYHIYKGGSDFAGLKMLAGTAMHAFHVNDYPADPPRETIRDADRVYPGDGIAPISEILRTLHQTGFRGALSLELFNPTYYQQDVDSVLQTGLRKMQQAVAQALA